MIDISLEESMRCLQLFQEYQPENGYAHQCFNIGISALKTIEDMQLNGDYTPAPSENVSRETLKEIYDFDCHMTPCEECNYLYKGYCMSNMAGIMLKEDERKELMNKWINQHYNKSQTT